MSWVDALIGAGSALAGGGLTYFGTSRDRRQRAKDAREDRNYASRREACLLLERQRTRQLETAEALASKYRRGETFEERIDHTDIQNTDVDAMVSIFLPERIERLVEEVNGLWSGFLSACGAIDRAELGQPRIDAVTGMNGAFDRLRDGSRRVRQALREEALSK